MLTTAEFIEKAKRIHGDKYDYSLSVYLGAHEKLTVICPLHGSFQITPGSHANRGSGGCKVCRYERVGNAKRKPLEEFVAQAKLVHGNRYDYSLIKGYVNNKEKVPVICHEHGVFLVAPMNHLRQRGCPSCRKCGYRKNRPGHLYVLQTLLKNLKAPQRAT
jgi:hypothetical protein